MARFQSVEAFAPISSDDLILLPLRFERLKNNRVAVANMVGDIILLDESEFLKLIGLNVVPGDTLYERGTEHLILGRKGRTSVLQLLALRLRSRMAFLRAPTGLHILVVTLRCEHSCPYCQVSRRSTDVDRYDMSKATAL